MVHTSHKMVRFGLNQLNKQKYVSPFRLTYFLHCLSNDIYVF